jgi:hypothetical protein
MGLFKKDYLKSLLPPTKGTILQPDRLLKLY